MIVCSEKWIDKSIMNENVIRSCIIEREDKAHGAAAFAAAPCAWGAEGFDVESHLCLKRGISRLRLKFQ